VKACPTCGRLYPADAGFCPVDGSGLTSATQVPVAPDDSDRRVGQLLKERYQIRRVVADGGMGRVYEALDMVERRNVAVKILHSEVARDPVQVERFKREFEVSRQLPHDHIVEVVDFSELSDGTFALVMEYLFGEELRQALDREKFIHPGRLVRIVSQVAIGLDKAHAKQLVHRDLKPDNVFLCQTPDGDIVKLLDFGSVKDKAVGAKKLTVMGTTIGSPFYMSPEQAQGLDTLDQRADIWALGAILYEAMTGKVPFYGVNGPQILLAILTKEATPASEVAEAKFRVPPSIDEVLGKAFKKTASLRYASVGEFADAFGHGFGLSGDHKQWAATPEGELRRLIEAKLDTLLAAPRAEKKKTAQDDFFGDSDSLGEVVTPAGGPAEESRPDPMQSAMRAADAGLAAQKVDDDPLPGQLSLPKNDGVPVWVYLIGVLLVGALVALLVL
jgi:serine/threonine protein kinase